MMKTSCQVLVLRDKGFTLTTPTNAILDVTLTRDQYHRHQVTEGSTTFNTVEIIAHSYSFDALGRATNAVRSLQQKAKGS